MPRWELAQSRLHLDCDTGLNTEPSLPPPACSHKRLRTDIGYQGTVLKGDQNPHFSGPTIAHIPAPFVHGSDRNSRCVDVSQNGRSKMDRNTLSDLLGAALILSWGGTYTLLYWQLQ